MKINTKVVFEWNDESKQYEEISCESYDYNGDIAECQDYNYPLIYPELQGIGNFEIPSLIDEETKQYLNQSSSGGLLGQPQTLNPDILAEKPIPIVDPNKIPGRNIASTDATAIGSGSGVEEGVTMGQFDSYQQDIRREEENPSMALVEVPEVLDAESAAEDKKPWGGLLGPDTKIGKSIGAFGKKGGLLGMAMKGMGVEGAGDIMNQFSGAMNKAMGANKQEPLNQQDYISDVQSAANVSAPTYQRQEGSFY